MKNPAPVLAIIALDVKDYSEWRKHFEAGASFREKSGIVEANVFRNPEHPNKVFVTQHFSALSDAHSFLAKPEWKDRLRDAGVIGAPDVTLGVAA